ncbi:hypothetical protein BGZ65_006754 [Modicella reniformis]|uniref:Uncharacterized protein n=1 Tax=Modicella reniformis TaxID=1440133 RepID=A0A9P6MB42_9FUNG|nr:hypothetical protein BGZ65_006754 [Modicella reniformis]
MFATTSDINKLGGLTNESLIQNVDHHLRQEERRKLVCLNLTNKGVFENDRLRSIELFSLSHSSKEISSNPKGIRRALVRRTKSLDADLKPRVQDIRLLVTASIDTFERLGVELTNLHHLIFKVDISQFTGDPSQTAVSYQRILEDNFLPVGLNPETASTLREWAEDMVKINRMNPTEWITAMLRRNPLLKSVWIQLQRDYEPWPIIETLGTFTRLESLCIAGSDVRDDVSSVMYRATEVVLQILRKCPTLQELTFRDLPTNHPFNNHVIENFASSITKLDLSGVRHGPIGVRCDTHRIILRCPLLKWLAFPQRLSPTDIKILTGNLTWICRDLRSLTFTDSNLWILTFKAFMRSLTILTHVSFKRCVFFRDHFRQWVDLPAVRNTIQQVEIRHRPEGQKHAVILLRMLPASPIGMIDTSASPQHILKWKRAQL